MEKQISMLTLRLGAIGNADSIIALDRYFSHVPDDAVLVERKAEPLDIRTMVFKKDNIIYANFKR
jgi:hypothetical protein